MILDSSEYTPFSFFASDGVKTTDTFNSWRKKTNGLVQAVNLLEANSTDAESPIIFDATSFTLRIKTAGIKTINLENLSVTGEKIANLTITEGKLAANSVTEAKIFTGAVTESKIGSGAVTEAKIGTGAVTTVKLGNQAVTETKIGPLAVTEAKIGTGAVTNAKIAAEAVTEAKIGTGAVTTEKLGTQAVTTPKIQDLSVVETKLGDSSVTNAKIGAAAVSEAKIQNGAVTTTKIGANTVTADKLSGDQTGVAPIFAARAFGSFTSTTGGAYTNRVTSAYVNATYVINASGTTITMPSAHNLRVGHMISFSRTSSVGTNLPNGRHVVTDVISSTQFKLAFSAVSGSGTIQIHFINPDGSSSRNVASICYLDDNYSRFVVNLTEPLPSANYAVIGSGFAEAGGADLAAIITERYARTRDYFTLQNYYVTRGISFAIFG